MRDALIELLYFYICGEIIVCLCKKNRKNLIRNASTVFLDSAKISGISSHWMNNTYVK